MYARTSFRGAKTCKIWRKKMCVFGYSDSSAYPGSGTAGGPGGRFRSPDSVQGAKAPENTLL